MEEIYKKLHETNEDWVEEKRRARDYQAAIYEKNKALELALECLLADGYVNSAEVVRKALEI